MISSDGPILDCADLSRQFSSDSGTIAAVESAELKINPGELVVVSGPSGSGKTTLLLMAAAMLRPTSGTVNVLGESIYDLSNASRTKLRSQSIATILPLFHLLPYLSTVANVMVGGARSDRQRAEALLEQLALKERLRHRPDQLSSGERRRVMVARALISGAPLLLADEPTANLDEENAEIVRSSIRDHVTSGGASLVVTHEPPENFAADHAYAMKAGRLSRAGRASSWVITALASVIALIFLIFLMMTGGKTPTQSDASRPIQLICAAGMKPAVEEVIEEFRRETDREVHVSYGGSGTLLGQLKIDPDCADLYLAADESYVNTARDEGLVAESIPIATMKPVLAVAKGNPHGIASLDDLLEEDLRIGLANPGAAAVGKISKVALEEVDLWNKVEPLVKVYKPTVNEIANDLHLGTIDVVIVWDTTVAQYDDLEALSVPELDRHVRTVEIGVVASSEYPTDALLFARFIAARDKGATTFESHGFGEIEGDVWSEQPKILLYAGSMFNQPIEDTIRVFETREGVVVDRIYNGCGILVSQMNAGGSPDAFLACDASFMDVVDDRFRERVELSENPMVIIVEKGNPHDIQTMRDLLKPDLKVGLSHPEKSALGSLTQEILENEKLLAEMKSSGNWILDAPQGDFLTNAMRTGSLDAAIVYRSNALPWIEDLELIPIELPGAIAQQPAAVATMTDHPRLAERLLARIRSADSATRFREYGFTWLEDKPLDRTDRELEPQR